jgi:hypothetical protein
MKMILLLGLSAVGFAAADKILESPDLLPIAAWETVPSIAGADLSADDLAAINRRFKPVTAQERRAWPAWDARFSRDPGSQDTANAFASAKPVLLVQAAQAPVAPTPLQTPVPPEAPTPPPPPDEEDQLDAQREAARALERAKQEVERSKLKMERDLQHTTAAVKDLGNFRYKFGASGQEQRSLVIRSSETDSKSLAAAEEDLNVMARILDRAVAKTGEGEDKKAMGVSLISFGSGVKNFQIEGFGAVFLLKVGFPLSGPPAKEAEEKPEQSTNSAWDEAKRELYGPREGTAATKWSTSRPAAARVAYDPKRVDELKESLLEALKNASNMRALKGSDSVTVVVTSGEAQGGPLVNEMIILNGAVNGAFGGPGENWMEVRPGVETGRTRSAARAGSTLSIRAKKADVDAFSQGKMNLDEFRKQASMVLY